MRSLRVVLTSGILALLRAAPVDAAPPASPQKAAALSWQRLPGAESCAGLKELSLRVDAHLGRSAFVAPSNAQLTIDASIAPTSDQVGWAVRIRVSDGDGQQLGNRELLIAKPACSEAIETAALTLALLVDPDALSRPQPPEAVDAPRPSQPRLVEAPPLAVPSPVAGAVCPPPPAPPPASSALRPAWRARLSVGFLGSLGQLPRFGSGVAGGVSLTTPDENGGIRVGGSRLLQQRDEIRPGSGASFAASGLELAAFWSPVHRPGGHVSLGGGAALGQIRGDAFNLTTKDRGASAWLANALLEVELGWQLSERWSVLLRPQLGIPLVRERFEITTDQGQTLVFRPTLVGQVGAAIGFSL